MNTQSGRWAARYQLALHAMMAPGVTASLARAGTLGRQALGLGLGPVALAEVHERAVVALLGAAADEAGTVSRAGPFFRRALGALLAPARRGQPAAGATAVATWTQAQLQQRLTVETCCRQAAEAALKRSRVHHQQLLAQSRLMQQQLRHLSHQILLAQEEERKNISRELHDEISQILTGINVRLAALKIEVSANTGNLKQKITNTQRLVEKSVEVVHRFARELRPAMLDDLGLIPALLAHVKEFGRRTGLRVSFTTVTADKLKRLDSLKRTMLYRVAQEALTNVDRHAHATLVKLSISLLPASIVMEITDNGKAFDSAAKSPGRRPKRLGITGMRERAEMVGGTFAITSTPGSGTTVRVAIPYRHATVS